MKPWAWLCPASGYQVSSRSFSEVLPAIEYSPGDRVRKVDRTGSFQNRVVRISKAVSLLVQ